MEIVKGAKRERRSGLGRGLSALISATPVSLATRVMDAVSQSSNDEPQELQTQPIQQSNISENVEITKKVVFLPIDQIVNNPVQPRQRFNDSEIDELAGSIKSLGVLQPVLVRPCEGDLAGRYEIVAGERRWRAARKAGLTEVPALINPINDQESLEIALVENIQRSNLNPVEEAQAYQRLLDEFSLSQQEIAQRVGKDRASIANYLRLLTLAQPVLEFLSEGKLSMGHAKAILTIKEPAAQTSLAKKVLSENLSVRALEAIVSRVVVLDAGKRPATVKTAGAIKADGTVPPEILDRMRNALGTKVIVKHHPSGRGKIEVEYFSEQELDRIVELICR